MTRISPALTGNVDFGTRALSRNQSSTGQASALGQRFLNSSTVGQTPSGPYRTGLPPISPCDGSMQGLVANLQIQVFAIQVLLDLTSILSGLLFQPISQPGNGGPSKGKRGGRVVIQLPGNVRIIFPQIQAYGGSQNGGMQKGPVSAGETFSRLTPVTPEAAGRWSNQDLATPRDISNGVADQGGQETKNANDASDLLWSWGQFIDHDLALTQEGGGHADIAIPMGDRDLDPTGTGKVTIPFERSGAVSDGDGNRQQVNEQTPLVDASMVYGASEEETAKLRSFEGGRMKMTDAGFLPDDPDTMVLAGDKRAAEQPGLLSLHTLFVREHNRLAALIAQNNPAMDDEQLFDAASRYVTAEIQAITYNEFLPVLVGADRADPSNYRFGPGGNDGKVSNEFASAAYRLGHTLVSDQIAVKRDDGSLETLSLDEAFFAPEFTSEWGIGNVLAGQSEQTSEKVDPLVVDSLRNRLFGPPGVAVAGLDLAALNIQRGRDHDMPSYNGMRVALGLAPVERFDDPIFQDGFGAKLASVYDSPDQIDLWVGGLAENPIGNSMLGETFSLIVGEQFAKLAKADGDFYTRSFSGSDRAWLDTLTLSDVIRANAPGVQIDSTAFIAEPRI